MKHSLPPDLQTAVNDALHDWTHSNKVERFLAHDKTLWTNTDEDQWMGWLDIADHQLEHRKRFEHIADDIKSRGYKNAVLLGMGGSSLCPEVLALTFGKKSGFPQLHILDSTDPAQVARIAEAANPGEALVIVSSKSGSTLEPNIFKQFFFERACRDGARFIAITDPGSKMQAAAEADNFDRICFGIPSIGGRYSALSDFGMVPAAAIGIDTKRFLENAQRMAKSCRETEASKNPGVALGLILGTLQTKGRDKLTIVTSPAIHDLGAWLEQLIAESTGKLGKAIIPVDREPLAAPQFYSNDRVFAYVRHSGSADPNQDEAVAALRAAGHPVVQLDLDDIYELGAEFYRWEIATAVAGSVMGINPFNQPDVEAAKIATRELTSAYEKTGTLPTETPVFDPEALRQLLAGVKGGTDYVAILAYIDMTEAHEAILQQIRTDIRNQTRAATCLGFGPRFQHSTGQAYKGGPNTGVIIQITCDDPKDVPIPGQKYSFSIVKEAQAAGDLAVLKERGRRTLRIHLTGSLESALKTLQENVAHALAVTPKEL
jgi:transaldolase/glucose-6-phosphate isomerase